MQNGMATESLIAEIDEYLRQSGMSESAFGKGAVGDPCFVSDVRQGREPRSRVVAKVRDFMATSQQAAQ